MKNEFDLSLDLEIEVIQVSMYCDIIRNLMGNIYSMSIVKIAVISFIIKKRQYLGGNIFNGRNTTDLVLKFLSQASGLFDDFCEQLPYILQSMDILVKFGLCEAHENELMCLTRDINGIKRYDSFTESVIREINTYTDRQFLKEVINIV